MAFATIDLFSKSLKRTVTVNAVVPTDKFMFPASAALEKKPLKTLYLLHGVFGDYTDWVHGTRVQALATAHDLCVIMPSGDNKFYCDSGITGDMYGSFIGKELVELTRDLFPLSRAREDTFIGGLSMGGFGAVTNALRNTDTFGACCMFSSALIKEKIQNSVDEPGHDIFTRRQYMSMFGIDSIEDFEGCSADYEYLAREASGGEKPAIYMACGLSDGLMRANVAYRDLLSELGYAVTWEEWPGGHEWGFWDKCIERAIEWLPLGKSAEGVSSGNVGRI